MQSMWIPKWLLAGWPAFLFAGWLLKIRFHDLPAQRRQQLADAKREEKELQKYRANVMRADWMLETLVERGAPVCLLWDRKFSDRKVLVPEQQANSPMFLYESYQTYHEARKLYQD